MLKYAEDIALSAGSLVTPVSKPLHAVLALHEPDRQQEDFHTRLCRELVAHGVASLRIGEATSRAIGDGLAHLRGRVLPVPAVLVAMGARCGAAVAHATRHASEVGRLVLVNPTAGYEELLTGLITPPTLIVHGAGDAGNGASRATAELLVPPHRLVEIACHQRAYWQAPVIRLTTAWILSGRI